jgi:hypothetical protein
MQNKNNLHEIARQKYEKKYAEVEKEVKKDYHDRTRRDIKRTTQPLIETIHELNLALDTMREML